MNIKYATIIMMLLCGCQDVSTQLKSESHIIKPAIQKPIGTAHNDVNGVYRLFNQNGQIEQSGTAFFISYNDKKYLITAKHVISSGQISLINSTQSADFKIIRILKSQYSDITAIEVSGDNIPCLKVAGTLNLSSLATYPTAATPSSIHIYGYPHKWGFRKICGLFIGKVVLDDNIYLVSNCVSQSGMSGAPWINGNNEVIGIHSMSMKYGDDLLSCAVPINDLIKLIDQ